ncbi:nitrate- and nitrite sensing domain-containing protein [Streptomyces sp. GbtcB6]|uniref:sensor histidine kinase n=1 Tax=Streptomyces sp. GbtcB6 TaxID=2824751 RepID=UPI001C30A9F9|nr:nitrate- and nitrite sensing domain-containing protein [Streptomyces sp. GbtcB6]
MSLRTTLLILALVPTIAMIALWATNSAQLYGNWKSINDRNNAGKRLGQPIVGVFYQLQAERQLSAAALADPNAGRSGLAKQRELTDRAVQGLTALSDSVPGGLTKSFQQLSRGLAQLPEYRNAVDKRDATQDQMFDSYTGVIASDMQLFEEFTNVGIGEVNVLTRPVLDAQWGQEMLSRESTIFTAGTVSGHLTSAQRLHIAEVIGSQQHIYENKVIPRLPGKYAKTYQRVLSGAAWKQKTRIEQQALTAEIPGADGRTPVSAQLGKEWQQSYGALAPQLLQASGTYSEYLVDATNDKLGDMMTDLVVDSTVGAAAVLLVFLVSLKLTGVLRRRILGLRAAALELQTRLPDMVERLRQGETVDTDAELPEIHYGNDELGMLGQALNQARSSALETAVRQVEQYRGFERLLQRIARRTQLLIGMQMKRLSMMQRQHEDPEVLEGLFDVDHLAARLRRYEENLVILGGGQPQRRWRNPVLLLDLLRSAQGEVQDYRRIRIDTEDDIWLSERAVGPMVHVLAELMENAVSFSKPPTPVEVSASRVGRGVAIEIEDRGMGMDPEQYAEANRLMTDPPRMDVMSRADDARLGLYVVARLSANLGLNVELRPSSFGGTRVVVLVPAELISDGKPRSEAPDDAVPAQLAVIGASRSGQDGDPGDAWPEPQPQPQLQPRPGDQEASAFAVTGPRTEPPARAAVAPPTASPNPLPRRVRQASLAAELRDPSCVYAEQPHAETSETEPETGPEPLPRRTTSRRSGATVGAFQRQSRIARLGPDSDQQPTQPSPRHDGARKEDGR